MENEKKLKRRRARLDLVAQIKKNKAVFAVYIVLRLIVIVSLVFALVRGNFENAVLCVATLLLLLAPSFIEKSFSVELPSVFEIIIMCFAFSHAILGEIGCFYVKVPWWDTMLHTLNGFLCAGVGFSLIDLLNRDKRFRFELSPVYVALVAFCFSMTVGVLWEFFEFGSDMIFKTDMQKDTVIRSITSVALDPTKSNTPVTVDKRCRQRQGARCGRLPRYRSYRHHEGSHRQLHRCCRIQHIRIYLHQIPRQKEPCGREFYGNGEERGGKK